MKVTGKAALIISFCLFLLSVLATLVFPAIMVFIKSGELNFSHLQDLGEFVFAYFVFGPPVITSGTLSVFAFIILKDRLGTRKSVWIAFGTFILLLILLNTLAVQAVIRGIMFVIDSA